MGVWVWLTPTGSQRISLQYVGRLIALVGGAYILTRIPSLAQIQSETLTRGVAAHSGVWASWLGLGGVAVIALRPYWATHPRRFLVLCGIGIAGWLAMVSATFPLSNPVTFPEFPPVISGLGIGLAVLGGLPLALPMLRTVENRKRWAILWLIVMIAGLYVLKVESVRDSLFSPGIDYQWIGLSYIAFRLLHVLIDWREDALEQVPSLTDFILYLVFFPTLLAGPITRVEEVTPQLSNLRPTHIQEGIIRIGIGLFKKFVLAAWVGLIALSPNLAQTGHGISLLIALYGAFILFFLDFSGYSDIAVGLGLLYGIRLPENFDHPLGRPNIQQFWANWHISLSTWFRQYWFNPLTRRLLQTPLKRRQNTIILITQLSTMVLIGLWHGLTINWVVWGLWNGFGLWGYKVISDRTKKWFRAQTTTPSRARLAAGINGVLTFHYVLISFSFAALPTLDHTVQFWVGVFAR
jgi:D-alanyl-lipoteichoic acid acyltransferase DltB (MBOAT superfamily)